jgi:hypothetical protein
MARHGDDIIQRQIFQAKVDSLFHLHAGSSGREFKFFDSDFDSDFDTDML